MAITKSKLTVWSMLFNSELETMLTANRLVASDIIDAVAEKGETVNINRVSDIDTIDYDPNGNAFEDITDSQITVTFDQDKITPFSVKETDAFWSNKSLITESARKAAYSMKKTFDNWVYATYPTLCDIVLDDGAGNYLVVNSSNILTFLGDVLVAFGEADVPDDMRTVSVPVFMDPLIRNLEIANKDSAGMGQGFIADVYGMKFYRTNNINQTIAGEYDMVGGYDGAFQAAIAYNKLWTGGLQVTGKDATGAFIHSVYGGNAVKPEAMILMKVKAA